MEIVISVRELVEFIQRSGDIDNTQAAGSEDAMLEGARLHRWIQKSMGASYKAEVPLFTVEEYGDYSILIQGRADGVIREEGRVTVDEIKCTYRDLKRIGEPQGVHLSQARCYAYMILKQEQLDEISVRLTYCHIKSKELRFFHETLTRAELVSWFEELMTQYRKWADFEVEWKKIRKESLQQLTFPYPFREGQKELSGHVYQTICHEKKLFIQAPTGVGKTLSTLFPSLKAVGLDKADKIFYLTAKTVTGAVAEETARLLASRGMKAKTLMITAKEKICPLEKCECNPQACPYAKGHYDRINDCVYALLTEKDMFDRRQILEAAKEHMVCPFELSLDMSLFADIVVCDYNYLFDPYVRLKRFFAQGSSGQYLFLIDEAHNLLDRGRSMYSADLVKEDILALKREVKGKGTGLDKHLERANKSFLELKKQELGRKTAADLSSLNIQLSRLHAEIGTYLEEREDQRGLPVREKVLEYYFLLGRYLDTWDRIDESYLIYTEMTEEEDFALHLYCVDPASQLEDCMELGVSSILFSATLLPIQYYKGLLGGTKEDFEVYARTSFSADQFCLLISGDVTTKYTERGPEQYHRIAREILDIISVKKGNYMVFFPSYQFLAAVLEEYGALETASGPQEVIFQSANMTEEERGAFLARFQEENPATLLGFCVMGGIFSEGIDLKGERLIGAIVVGNGLPQISREGELLKEYFDERGEKGFDFAYRYPGMNKVLQAAGRVIRTSEDKGVIALLDYRFCQKEYQKLFPREWSDYRVVSAGQWEKTLAEFWNK